MGVQMLVGVIENPVWLHMLYVSLLTYLEHKVDEFFGRSGVSDRLKVKISGVVGVFLIGLRYVGYLWFIFPKAYIGLDLGCLVSRVLYRIKSQGVFAD